MEPRDYLPRLVDEPLGRALASFPIVVLDGPRGVGKTTTAMRASASAIRLPQDLALLSVDPAAALAGYERPVLIDEWQLAGTDLLWTLKQLVDDEPAVGQFILTGSVEPASYGPTYPLTGRATRLEMLPMTSAELGGRGHSPTFLEQLANGQRPPRSAEPFDLNQLNTTGFPGAIGQVDPSMFLRGYASLVAQRAGDEGRDATRLMRSLAVLGVLSAQTVPNQSIWEAADINKSTWKAYEDLLKRVGLSTPLASYSTNVLSRLTRYPKRFLVDTALALAVAELSIDELRRDPALGGRYLESYVAQQLRSQVAASEGSMWHVRTTGGEREIDLLIEAHGKRIAVEVKAGRRPDTQDAKHLEWLHGELGDTLDMSIVAHTGEVAYPLGNHTWAVPITAM